MVTIVDYRAGNIRSVSGALVAIGANVEVTSDADRMRVAERLLVPGVGSFRSAMERLKAQGIDAAIGECASRGTPILGICLGMQLLCSWSDEGGGSSGLGFLNGRVGRFTSSVEAPLRVPHVGFNSVRGSDESELLRGIPTDADFYFAHSYRLGPVPLDQRVVTASTEYGQLFTSVIEMDHRIFGVQFHPELSQGNGLSLLRNFLDIEPC